MRLWALDGLFSWLILQALAIMMPSIIPKTGVEKRGAIPVGPVRVATREGGSHPDEQLEGKKCSRFNQDFWS